MPSPPFLRTILRAFYNVLSVPDEEHPHGGTAFEVYALHYPASVSLWDIPGMHRVITNTYTCGGAYILEELMLQYLTTYHPEEYNIEDSVVKLMPRCGEFLAHGKNDRASFSVQHNHIVGWLLYCLWLHEQINSSKARISGKRFCLKKDQKPYGEFQAKTLVEICGKIPPEMLGKIYADVLEKSSRNSPEKMPRKLVWKMPPKNS